MKRTKTEYFIRLLLLTLGLIVAHLGVTLFVLANLGSDPFTTTVQGVSIQLGFPLGNVHMAATALLIIIFAIFTRGYIKAGTFVCTLLGGPIINVFTWLLGDFINSSLPIWARLIVAAMGCVVLAAGMSMVIKSDAGTGANDLIAVIITDKIKKVQFRFIRMACDIIFTVAGFLLGGTVGVGTLIAVFLIGPVAQKCMPISEKLVAKFISKDSI